MLQSWPIPVHIIKKEYVDLESECLSSLGATVKVGRKLNTKPLSFGVMSMLEIMDNSLLKMLFSQDETIEPESKDLHAVFYLNHHRHEALEDVRLWFRGIKEPLEKKIKRFGKKHKIVDGYSRYVIDMLERAHSGFRMIPSQGSGGCAMLYGTEAQAYMAYVCANALNINHHQVIWETPLTLIGHTLALNAAENGVKNVERPDDVEQLNSFKAICEECDDNHELYPWQIDEPFKRGIFQWQHEEVLVKWVEAAQNHIKKNGQQFKADKNEINRVKSMYKNIRSNYLKELKAGNNG